MQRIHGFDSAERALAAVVGVMLLAASGSLLAQNAASGGAPSVRSGATSMTGSFTGEYVNGSPVYRLPSITVTVSRKAELARLAREDRLAAVAAKSAERHKAPRPAQVAVISDQSVK